MLEYYYHGTIRRVVVAFASLFNNIYISRKDGKAGAEIERIKVPISYGPRQKFLKRLERIGTDFDQQAVRLENYLPRIAFEIGTLQYDPTRKLNSIQRTVGYNTRSTLKARYERVPYNMGMTISVMTKSTDDCLQIVEQIVPYFTPEYVFTLKMIEGLDNDVDVPIILSSVSLSDTDDGSYGDYALRKVSFATLQFSTKIYLYGPVSEKPVILETDLNIFDTDDKDSDRELANRYARLTLTADADVTAGSYTPNVPGQVNTGIIEYPPEIDGITGP